MGCEQLKLSFCPFARGDIRDEPGQGFGMTVLVALDGGIEQDVHIVPRLVPDHGFHTVSRRRSSPRKGDAFPRTMREQLFQGMADEFFPAVAGYGAQRGIDAENLAGAIRKDITGWRHLD